MKRVGLGALVSMNMLYGSCGSDEPPLTCTDKDSDGYYAEGGQCGTPDCNDVDRNMHPGATEIPDDGIDQNCDSSDLPTIVCNEGETRSCYTGSAGTINVGICRPGTQTCSGDVWTNCTEQILPTVEIPDNGIDEDCDGSDLPSPIRVLEPIPIMLSSGLEALVIDKYSDRGDYLVRRPQTSIAADSNGDPLMVYVSRQDNVSYAARRNNTWQGSEIDSQGYATYNSVALDKNGYAHACFTGTAVGGAGESLLYATNKGGSWKSEVVDISYSVGLDNDIGIDGKGNVHISHWSWAAVALKYSTNSSGTWRNEELAPADWRQTSLAIDRNDGIHISFDHGGEADSEGKIGHLTNELGTWKMEEVQMSPQVTDYTIDSVLRFDSNNNLHIIGRNGGHIYHSWKENGHWQTEQVVPAPEGETPDTHSKLSMAVNIDDSLVVVYNTSEVTRRWLGKLSFATNRAGEWRNYVLDYQANSGDFGELHYQNPAIATDKQGNVHISVIYNPRPSDWSRRTSDITANPEAGAEIRYITFDPTTLEDSIEDRP